MPSATGVSVAQLKLIIHHVFLTPGDPQKGDDTDITRTSEEALLDYLCRALRNFGSLDTFQACGAVPRALEALKFLRDSKNQFGDLDAQKVGEFFERLLKDGGFAPVHVQAQNAAVIVSRDNDSIIFEASELAPKNQDTMSTQGRLKRHFPGSAVSTPLAVFNDPDLHFSLADALARMGIEEVRDMKPMVEKASQMHIEERDTTNPAIVTDFLTTILCALGERVQVPVLEKNTREQVSWRNARMPWRRSPLWLLARITIHTICSRAGETHVYKQFMVFFMSSLLDVAVSLEMPCETLYCMVAKISGRLKKLGNDARDCLRGRVGTAMSTAAQRIEASWKKASQVLDATLSMRDTSQFWRKDQYGSYPNLEAFINSIDSRDTDAASLDFKPSWSVPRHQESELPKALFSGKDQEAAFQLLAFEMGRLLDVIKIYHQKAAASYARNPEATSLMLLTIMELWVACDKSACKVHGLLQKYAHEIPGEVLQSLILPFKRDMERLRCIENYLEERKLMASERNPSIFSSFGESNSFAVQFFQNSAEHGNLKKDIETWAEAERKRKREEFRTKLQAYESHTSKAAGRQHEYFARVNYKTGHEYQVHSQYCQRCYHEKEAKNLTIEVHEWPLPSDDLAAQNVVFELKVPTAIERWRDAAAYMISSVLKSTSRHSYEMGKEDALSDYLAQYYYCQKSKRFGLVSTTKSHRRTHRKLKTLGTASEGEVLLKSGLKFRYYDNVLCKWAACFQRTDKITTHCTYRLSGPCSSLRPFLFRPPESPNGKSANHIISQQSECPEHLSLEEFRAMAALPCGYRVQWLNILTQLRMPVLNFTNKDVLQILLQVSRQVGPPEDSVYRAGHQFPSRENFAIACVEGLEAALDKMKENWESYHAVGGFIALAARLISLSKEEKALRRCFEFLDKCRTVLRRWMALLQEKVRQAETEGTRAEFLENSLHVAHIWVTSFDIDEDHLRTMLQSTDNAAMLLEASIAAHDASGGVGGRSIAQMRCERTLFKAFNFLNDKILRSECPCLDMAIQKAWSAYPGGATWAAASHPHTHWMTTAIQAAGTDLELTVHFNILTGELLVNGNPLSRLPAEYEQHPAYADLFGKVAIEVLPTDFPGMSLSSKKSFHGQTLFFGMSKRVPGDLLLVARSATQVYDLVPSRVFAQSLPQKFVNNYVHWYGRESQVVEFRDKKNPWKSSPDKTWIMKRQDQGWVLERQSQHVLLSLETDSVKHFAELLKPIEEKAYLHVVLEKNTKCLKVELPRLQLDFFTAAGCSRLYSRQFRAMYVDADQGIGTLVGLESKLVLRDEGSHRKVLIPNGEPNWSWDRSVKHVRVCIPHGASQRVHPYEVDTLLQRLVDNGSMQSKLVICHLHGLTSYCLPDKLTGKTGSEQALSILRSASLRSFEYLKEEDVKKLNRIAHLSPARQHYPKHLQCMETVEWDDQLSYLSQDNAFYFLVEDLFSQANDTNVFYPDEFGELEAPNHVDTALGKRYSIRAASFQVDGFGGENHTTNHDAVYQSRDRINHTAASKRAFQVAEMLTRAQVSLACSVPRGFVDNMWKTLSNSAQGATGQLSEAEIRYGSQWMEDQALVLKKFWCQLHRLLVTPSSSCNRFQVMMCLCTIAFSTDASLQALQCLAMFTRAQGTFDVEIPSAGYYQLSDGRDAKWSEIEAAAQADLTAFNASPEYCLPQLTGEDEHNYLERRRIKFENNQNSAIETFVAGVYEQWICSTPSAPSRRAVYLNSADAMRRISEMWESWYKNHCFHQYLLEVAAKLNSLPVTAARSLVDMTASRPGLQPQNRKSLITSQSMFMFSTPSVRRLDQRELNLGQREAPSTSASPRLALLLEKLSQAATSKHPSQRRYVEELQRSLEALESLQPPQSLMLEGQELHYMLLVHLRNCRDNVSRIYTVLQAAIFESLQSGLCDRPLDVPDNEWRVAIMFMAPRMSSSILLGNLVQTRWDSLCREWKEALVMYGTALTKLQRAERLFRAKSSSDIVKEHANVGHTNWDPMNQPENLLLEIESGILIREVQEDIASEMRSPEGGNNSVMQLNMGEGKSSVIVPIVAAYLADGCKLVRAVVGKPQSKELRRTLISKLGGLLSRQIFYMPFNRSLRLTASDVKRLNRLYRRCVEQGGILLVQPEHILSFKLMTIEYHSLPDGNSATEALVVLHHFFQSNSRDIVDESDENFSPKFELIYTMGEQRPIELSPERWIILQRLLDVVLDVTPSVQQNMPEGIEITHRSYGRFPRTRILRAEAGAQLLREIARRICCTGLPGLPIGRQSDKMRAAIFDYIIEENVSADQVALVETNDGFFTDSIKEPLLLLRGLMAGRVLLFALRQKRWRVNYGLDPNRTPTTRLAVPYRAKDSPSTRAEFSHPDVVILLTCLSSYYAGLTDEELFIAFNHVVRSDQAEIEYQQWVANAPELPSSFHSLNGVNLKDVDQVTREVFPHLRQAKSVVDYYLSQMIFPKEMKEFSHKLSSSGWDLGAQKSHATTGFSGTNDSRHVLPLDVKQLDIQDQLHTNALVLENLLRPESTVQLLRSSKGIQGSETDRLLAFAAAIENEVHVILDVGAQVLELTNIQVAKRWLELLPVEQKQEAVVFFDDDDETCVIDRKGVVERLQTSPYAEHLDRCLVFLDQAHTRGTDLKLPEGYRAAVTLGPDLTKDRLVQACMRMRKLGHGQSVVFCISSEMKARIHLATNKPSDSEVAVADVLMWAISETHADLQRLMPLWAIQGARFYSQKTTWDSTTTENGTTLTQELADNFLEEEAQTIEHRYRPKPQINDTDEMLSSFARLGLGEDQTESLHAIQQRCDDFGVSRFHSEALQEEQEKELAPEVEQERQIERPPPMSPAKHELHPDLKSFVATGNIPSKTAALHPAFLALMSTTVAEWIDLHQFPDDLLVTADYARTVLLPTRGGLADSFQRPVQYILTGCDASRAIVISPHEAQELLPLLTRPSVSSRVRLQLYAPRTTLGLEPLDALRLYTVPETVVPETPAVSDRLRLLLNLFAGQLYFASFRDYADTCDLLGLAWQPRTDGVTVETDGFIVGGEGAAFERSPVQGIRLLLTTLRRDGRDIGKTHWGRILGGEFLTEADFEA